MKALKPITVYIPVDIKKELPETEGQYYPCLFKSGNFLGEMLFDDGGFDDKVGYWLKPVEQYTFTNEELVELLDNTFKAGFALSDSEGRGQDKLTYFKSLNL